MINIYKSVLLYRKHIWIIVRRIGMGIMNSRGPAPKPIVRRALSHLHNGSYLRPRSFSLFLDKHHAYHHSSPLFSPFPLSLSPSLFLIPFTAILSLSLLVAVARPSRSNQDSNGPRFHLLSPEGGLSTVRHLSLPLLFVSPNSTRSRTLIVFSFARLNCPNECNRPCRLHYVQPPPPSFLSVTQDTLNVAGINRAGWNNARSYRYVNILL